MAVPSPSPAKSDLRAAALKQRRAYAQGLSEATREKAERALAALVLPHLAAARVVGAYHPTQDEISPHAILAGLAAGQRWALPWFAGDTDFLWREGPANEPGPWGIAQPTASAEMLMPDIVLVPLVLVDRRGTRIGRGKGHYDRALANLRRSARSVSTIGLCWPGQLVDDPLPADTWDIALDAVATPGEFVRCA